ncbi:MAG: septation protein A [Gammaproteobacteria bacterium]|jgi:intracellular septation protein
MKLLFDLFPVALFVITYFLSDIYVATGVMIVATLVQVAWLKFRDGAVPKIHLITLALLLFFGGLTIALQDPLFVKWKPTVVNWLFAIGFLVVPLFGGKTLPERMMGANIDLKPEQWRKLNISWILFFLLLGALNLAVAFNFSEAIWVNFKLFGLMGLTLLFAIGQGYYIVKYSEDSLE